MFNDADPPPSSKGRLLIGALALLVIAAGVVVFFWRPSLLGLGKGNAPPSSTNAGTNATPVPGASATPDKDQVAVLETTSGRIVFEFLPDIAPLHTVAFQNYFRQGFFDGTIFHRVIPKQAVQGGGPMSKDDYPFDDGMVPETLRRIPGRVFDEGQAHARRGGRGASRRRRRQRDEPVLHRDEDESAVGRQVHDLRPRDRRHGDRRPDGGRAAANGAEAFRPSGRPGPHHEGLPRATRFDQTGKRRAVGRPARRRRTPSRVTNGRHRC
ncbi:MAG: peptidylprolyl isomerase [Blastocatellia bacterium]|nr:peptidylprolyl isomerase [Blastocatellia bacterium]